MSGLQIRDLVVEYGKSGDKVRPIDSFNLELSSGSLALLLGPSGCGKTTLLSCIGGILKPTSGQILFDDIDVTTLDAKGLTDYRRNTVGIVFQAFNLVPSLTAAENVMVPMRAAGMSRCEARERTAELLDRVGLSDRTTHRPGDLSGGQQQRVAVARAIALDPPVILADEPTAHLDFIQVEEVLKLIHELSKDRLVVVATHDSRMLPLANRVIEMVPALASTDREPETFRLTEGSVVFEQNTMGDLIYVVADGRFEITREMPDGETLLLHIAGPGDYFGEIGPLFGLPRTATVRALTAGTVVGYTVKEFRARLGPDRIHELIEHRELDLDDAAQADIA
jgi:putative ABC transport system ATP-binding protein